MNTCIKCGCDDAYPSLPPCPTPVDCPNPQPCAEFFNAQCVRYTLPDIMCGLNIVVAQDSSIADALESIVLFFCTNFSNSVQSVTGLNTDNTDPLNPIVKISVDGITITGLGTPASPLIAVGGVDGSGTLNYLAKWTPDGSTLGNSLIRDDGTTIGIGIAPSSNALLNVSNASNNVAVRIDQLLNATATTNGAYITNTGINTQENRGLEISVSNSSLINTGLLTVVTANAPAVGTGGTFIVTGTSLSKYALRLQDGTQGSGKFLKSITANGEANWADITAADVSGVVGGSGTADYLARWTPSGTQLGTGLIRDNGTNVGINIAPGTIAKVTVANTTVEYTVDITNGNTGIGAKAGIRSITSGVNGTGFNTGATFTARNNTLFNIGVVGESDGASTKNIGGFFTATGGTDNYSIRLQDTTEGVGKVLTCMTATGEANWVTPSGGVSGSGINDYVARWTPDGVTLGTGLIRDDNTTVSIGAFPVAIYRVNIETSTQLYGLVVKNTYSSAANTNYTGIKGSAEGINTVGQNVGVTGYAVGNSNVNIGVGGTAASFSNKNVGVFASALNGVSNYAIQLNDGTNALGRVLTCVGVQGEANWGKVTSTYTTGASGSFVVGAQTITVTNGLITSIV